MTKDDERQRQSDRDWARRKGVRVEDLDLFTDQMGRPIIKKGSGNILFDEIKERRDAILKNTESALKSAEELRRIKNQVVGKQLRKINHLSPNQQIGVDARNARDKADRERRKERADLQKELEDLM